VLAIAAAGREPDTPGWTARVVPNKYPAFAGHEVVVHSPRHVRSVADLDADEIAAVGEAWKARADAARAAGAAYVQAIVNEGRAAGASLAHSHSQLLPLPEEPPLSRRERAREGCAVCDVVKDARESDRVVAARGDVELVCPRAARAPYELLIAPSAAHDGDAFADLGQLVAALELLADGVRRLHTAEGTVPLNAWLHTAPFGTAGHWHIEVLPRMSTVASLELGADIWLSSLAPEDAARRLRGD
jgi:UDPglucose--hexose-1-phosphate uridylyltransferase